MKSNLKLPADVEISVNEAISINQGCVGVQATDVLGGKVAYDISRLSDDTEGVFIKFQKDLRGFSEVYYTEGLKEDEINKKLEKKAEEMGEAKVTIRIPLLKMSDLIASRDYRLRDIKAGDSLVPVKFMKVMMKYIENDKDF